MKIYVLRLFILSTKLTIYGVALQCLFLSTMLAEPGIAQKIESVREVFVDLDIRDASLFDAFETIESKTDFVFAYDKNDFQDVKIVSIVRKNITVAEALMTLSKEANLKFRQVNNNINVNTRKKSESQVIEIIIQGKTITGRVTSMEDTEGLPGVNVMIKGTSLGTVTDVNGDYSIEAPSDESVLVFSSVGYNSEEIVVGSRSVIDLVMVQDITALEELVVIGYGEKKKETITGSISKASGSELKAIPVPNLENTLSGMVTGVYAISNSGQPGAEDVNLVIRGIGTLGDNQPTIVIDGVANRGGISRLDPNEIESVTVLKDASAAIYGSQSANGVILITTKRGSMEKAPQFSYSIDYGFQNPTVKVEYADAYEYASFRNDVYTDAGGTPEFTDVELEAMKVGADPDNGLANTDWWDETVQRNSPIVRQSLSLTGGSKKVSYFVSGGFLNQDGVFKNGAANYKQYNYRSNIDVQLNDYVKFGIDLAGRKETRDDPSAASQRDTWWSVSRTYPYWPAYYTNGLPWTGLEDGWNPVLMGTDVGGVTQSANNVFYNMISAEIKIPGVEGLSVDGWFAFDKSFSSVKGISKNYPVYSKQGDEYVEQRGGRSDGTNLSENRGETSLTTFHAKIKYDRFFDKHHISAFAAYEQSESVGDNISAYRRGYLTGGDDLQLFAGADEGKDNNGSAWESARRNYFSRVSYEYDGKYLLDATFRYDGSQNFPEESRFGFFPSVSAGYRISEEPFLSNAQGLDNLKFRASWGQLGNDRVAAYQFLTSYNLLNNQYLFGENNVVRAWQEGVSPNTNITWEVANTTNAGLDLSLWSRKLEFEFDYFNSLRTNILTPRNASVPDFTGLKLPDENIGEVKSNGIEFMLGHHNKIGALSYFVKGNYSYSNNEVVYMDETPTDYEYQSKTGKPYGSELYYPADGLLTQADLDAEIPTFSDQARPGDIKYLDTNGDGNINGDDRIRMDISTTLPRNVYGFSLGGQFKGFFLDAFFQGATGIYRSINVDDAGLRGNFIRDFFVDRWTEDNMNGTFPRVNFANTSPHSASTDQKTDFFLRDASYLRLRSAQFGYSFKPELLAKLKLQELKLYMSGSNLFFIFNEFEYGDPEQAVGGGNNGRFAYYPQQKIFNLGLSITF
ncbi:MAG: TonB-dependent receptor [Cyclobacteriaceae bacterium]|nr:TonB-dependent receptor [Cyclobacteriaceae bacterium]